MAATISQTIIIILTFIFMFVILISFFIKKRGFRRKLLFVILSMISSKFIIMSMTASLELTGDSYSYDSFVLNSLGFCLLIIYLLYKLLFRNISNKEDKIIEITTKNDEYQKPLNKTQNDELQENKINKTSFLKELIDSVIGIFAIPFYLIVVFSYPIGLIKYMSRQSDLPLGERWSEFFMFILPGPNALYVSDIWFMFFRLIISELYLIIQNF